MDEVLDCSTSFLLYQQIYPLENYTQCSTETLVFKFQILYFQDKLVTCDLITQSLATEALEPLIKNRENSNVLTAVISTPSTPCLTEKLPLDKNQDVVLRHYISDFSRSKKELFRSFQISKASLKSA